MRFPKDIPCHHIRVTDETFDRVKEWGKYGEVMEDAIIRVLDIAEEHTKNAAKSKILNTNRI
jgi:hypothetical protein